jgi:O-antigen/teichoic acid export membrane protein
MASSMKDKAIKGISWNLIERIGRYGIKFILGIILARLLTPKDYGLIGMITVFIAIAEVFIAGGFGDAYVQKKKVNNVDANTVFYTNLTVSILLYGVLWISASAIAGFYEQSQLIDLTRVIGLVIVFDALTIIQVVQLKRTLNFKRKTQLTLFSTILAGTAGITSAYNGLGVWSLVIQQLTNRAVLTSGLYLSSSWKPSFQFSKESFKSMFSFGSWMLLTGILKKIFENIYILTIGKFFPAAQLGFYTKAKQFQKLISQQLGGAIGEVSFPVFSQMQDDKQKLKNAIKKFLTHTLVFTTPLLVIFIVIAKPFVLLLLTEKWAPMIPFLQLLCVIGILYPIQLINVQVLVAKGKSKLSFRLDLIKNGLRLINILVTYRFGIIFIILGEVAISVIALFINTYYTKKFIKYGLYKQIKDISLIFFGALASGLAGYLISSLFNSQWLVFIMGLSLTGIIYLGFQYLFNYKLYSELLLLKKKFLK